MVEQHYRWDFIGLSTDTKPTPATSSKVVDGSTYYTSDDSKLYIWYKDQWYEKEATGGGGSINVINNLDSSSTTDALSAAMGQQLKYMVGDATNMVYIGDIELNWPMTDEPDGYIFTGTFDANKLYYTDFPEQDAPVKFYYTDTDYIEFNGVLSMNSISQEEDPETGETVETWGFTIIDYGTGSDTPVVYVGKSQHIIGETESWVSVSLEQLGGGSAVKTLTEADYNYPANNPTQVALWLLPSGFYNKGNLSTANVKFATNIPTGLASDSVAFVGLEGNFGKPIYSIRYNRSQENGSSLLTWYSVITGGTSIFKGDLCMPINDLTSTSTDAPLSANQGRVLKGLIDAQPTFWYGTQAEYDAITTKDPDTIYLIQEV